MKKSQNTLLIGLLLVFIISFFACEKEEEINKSIVKDVSYFSKQVEKNNERLVFKDSVVFREYLQWAMSNQDKPDLLRQIAESNGVKSMAIIYQDAFLYEEGSKEFDEYISTFPNVFYLETFEGSNIYELQAPLLLAYVCNSDGIYQVGNTICRIAYDKYYEITSGNDSRITEIVETSSLINDFEIQSNYTQSNLKGVHGYRTVYFTDKKRMVGRLRTDLIGNFYYYRITNSSQKKILGAWVGNKFMRLRVCWNDGYYRDPGSAYPNTNISIDAYDSGYESTQNIEGTFCISFSPVNISVH